jgi:hypothetical protein
MPRRLRRPSVRCLSILAAAVIPATVPLAARAILVTADQVVQYAPGNAPANFRTSSAPLGALSGNTTFGGLNPFNPAFSPNQILWVGAGGSLTLHLSSPIPANGINLGVFSNVGIVDTSQDGSGQAGNPAATIGQISRAAVAVSQDGVSFVPLNGSAPVTFSAPANYYTDTAISNGFQPLGSTAASQSKPFFGNLQSFAGQSYSQMKTTLNGSAGGTWLDLRGAVPAAVNYVKFDVASGDRLVVDSIGGLGAVNASTLIAGSRVISEDVGSGAHTSHVVVDFGPQSYDFAVHYDGSISGLQALQTLAADTNDFKLTTEHFSFGDLVTGIDYGGYSDIGDGSMPPDFQNYWSYWNGDGSAWHSATTGAGDHLLTDGSYDGWVWNPAQAAPPDFAIVPEPAAGGLTMLALASLGCRRRRRL